jgi:hypothetical protein
MSSMPAYEPRFMPANQGLIALPKDNVSLPMLENDDSRPLYPTPHILRFI